MLPVNWGPRTDAGDGQNSIGNGSYTLQLSLLFTRSSSHGQNSSTNAITVSHTHLAVHKLASFPELCTCSVRVRSLQAFLNSALALYVYVEARQLPTWASIKYILLASVAATV